MVDRGGGGESAPAYGCRPRGRVAACARRCWLNGRRRAAARGRPLRSHRRSNTAQRGRTRARRVGEAAPALARLSTTDSGRCSFVTVCAHLFPKHVTTSHPMTHTYVTA